MPLGMGREGLAYWMSYYSISLLLPAFLYSACWELVGEALEYLEVVIFQAIVKCLAGLKKIKPQLLFSMVQLLAAIALFELLNLYHDL